MDDAVRDSLNATLGDGSPFRHEVLLKLSQNIFLVGAGVRQGQFPRITWCFQASISGLGSFLEARLRQVLGARGSVALSYFGGQNRHLEQSTIRDISKKGVGPGTVSFLGAALVCRSDAADDIFLLRVEDGWVFAASHIWAGRVGARAHAGVAEEGPVPVVVQVVQCY